MPVKIVKSQCCFRNILNSHFFIKISINMKKRFDISTNKVLHHLPFKCFKFIILKHVLNVLVKYEIAFTPRKT